MNFLLIYGRSAKTLQWRISSDYGTFISLEEAEERAEEYAGILKEIMERIGSELLHPVSVKAEVKIMKTLANCHNSIKRLSKT